MLEKISWFLVHGLRGGVYAVPLMLLSFALIFINNNLQSVTEGSVFAFLINYLSNGLMLLALGAWSAAAVVWLATWISDYWTGYLPNWVRREIY